MHSGYYQISADADNNTEDRFRKSLEDIAGISSLKTSPKWESSESWNQMREEATEFAERYQAHEPQTIVTTLPPPYSWLQNKALETEQSSMSNVTHTYATPEETTLSRMTPTKEQTIQDVLVERENNSPLLGNNNFLRKTPPIPARHYLDAPATPKGLGAGETRFETLLDNIRKKGFTYGRQESGGVPLRSGAARVTGNPKIHEYIGESFGLLSPEQEEQVINFLNRYARPATASFGSGLGLVPGAAVGVLPSKQKVQLAGALDEYARPVATFLGGSIGTIAGAVSAGPMAPAGGVAGLALGSATGGQLVDGIVNYLKIQAGEETLPVVDYLKRQATVALDDGIQALTGSALDKIIKVEIVDVLAGYMPEVLRNSVWMREVFPMVASEVWMKLINEEVK